MDKKINTLNASCKHKNILNTVHIKKFQEWLLCTEHTNTSYKNACIYLPDNPSPCKQKSPSYTYNKLCLKFKEGIIYLLMNPATGETSWLLDPSAIFELSAILESMLPRGSETSIDKSSTRFLLVDFLAPNCSLRWFERWARDVVSVSSSSV